MFLILGMFRYYFLIITCFLCLIIKDSFNINYFLELIIMLLFLIWFFCYSLVIVLRLDYLVNIKKISSFVFYIKTCSVKRNSCFRAAFIIIVQYSSLMQPPMNIEYRTACWIAADNKYQIFRYKWNVNRLNKCFPR